MATFQVTAIGKDYLSTGITDMSPSTPFLRKYLFYRNGELDPNCPTVDPYIGITYQYFTYWALTPDTSYSLYVEVYNNETNGLVATFGPIVETTLPDLEFWYWTTNELNAFNNNGLTTVLTAARWNSFVNRINEAATADGSYWYTDYATLNGTYISAGGILTATKFNSARYNIGSRPGGGTGITDRYTGDIVYGSFFVTLQNSLNSWISGI